MSKTWLKIEFLQAQIKTHTKVQQDNVTYKKCNIAECDFQTVSMTQLIVHKTKVHGAVSYKDIGDLTVVDPGFRIVGILLVTVA